MTDVTEEPPRSPRLGIAGRFDYQRAAFWTAICMGAAGAGVTVAAGPTVGPVGAVLLIGVATTGVVFLMWLMGLGKYVGLYPAKGATEAASFAVTRSEFGLIEALDEPAFVAENGAVPVVANASYMAAAQSAGALGESARPPTMDRLFGADPVVAAPMYRLANAARRGQTRREELPATAIGRGALKRFEASVSPIPGGRTLWRLRDLGGSNQDETTPADPRRLFIDEAPIGFLSARADGSILYMNQALRAVLGVGEADDQLKLRDIMKEDISRLLRRERNSFGPARTEITLRARDGVETPAMALTSWPAVDGDGGSRTLIFFNGGEAAPENTATPRRAPSGPIDGFFENAPFGAAVLDSGDPAVAAILDSNTALMDMVQGRAAPGAAFADLFDASEGPAELAKKLRAASSAPVELTLATSPPRAAHVHFARGADGKGLAYIVNVTEQREIEQRLAQSDKMREIGTLASGIAHDFNNTLTVVMHSTEFLLSRHPVGDPDFDDLNKINQYTLRSRELTEMLLAVARQKTLKREITDVSAMVMQVYELARRVVGDRIEFKVNHARDLPNIKVDKTELERVLVNLVTNARDAINAKDDGRGGKLIIGSGLSSQADAHGRGHYTVAPGEYVTIEVTDNGMGIKPEDQQRIFRSFFSTKEPGKGTGLGLTTSYNIVKQLGGYIFFDSAVGQGTTFRIYMPAYEMTAEDHEEMARRDRERLKPKNVDLAARGKILLVEDEDGVRRALARSLQSFGCEIVEAENGEDALDVLAANPAGFDLIISDVSMPLMTGPEMLRAMPAEHLGKAKVLFLSGYAPESFAQLLEQYPVSFLSKPVGGAELAGKVRELLGV